MINCGGPVDVIELFGDRPDLKVYIIDSHRPFHLVNCVEENTNVCVLIEESEEDRLAECVDAFKYEMVEMIPSVPSETRN